VNKTIIRLKVLDEYEPYCVFCGKPASDLHHAIIGHKKALDKKLFHKYNLVPSCNDCNARKRTGDTPEYHHYFWLKHCEKYGKEKMKRWLSWVNEGLIIPYKPQIVPAGFIEWVKEI